MPLFHMQFVQGFKRIVMIVKGLQLFLVGFCNYCLDIVCDNKVLSISPKHLFLGNNLPEGTRIYMF